MMTIENAYEMAAEMHNSLSKGAVVALTEDISGKAWSDCADNAINWIAGWLLECDGANVTRADSDAEVTSAEYAD